MNKYKGNTKVSLTIRMVVGGYLIYTAMSLMKAIPQSVGIEKIAFILFIAFFSIVGVLLLFFSGKALLRGDFDNGRDAEDSETEIIDETDRIDEIHETETEMKKEMNDDEADK